MKHAGTQPISTARLTLRRIEIADAGVVFINWRGDPEVARYMRWTPTASVEQTANVIRDWFDGYASNSTYHWGICLPNGEMIGSVGVFDISDHDLRGEIGYCLGRRYWGNGYAAEAVEAVIKYMFINTDIQRIEAYHSIKNPASGRVMAKAGMIREGHSRAKYMCADGFQDCDLYGITRRDIS